MATINELAEKYARGAYWQDVLVPLAANGNTSPEYLARKQYEVLLKGCEIKQSRNEKEAIKHAATTMFISSMVNGDEKLALKAIKTGLEYKRLENIVKEIKLLEEEGESITMKDKKKIEKQYTKAQEKYEEILREIKPAKYNYDKTLQ